MMNFLLRNRQKLFVIFLSLVCIIIIFELSLRCLGAVYKMHPRYQPRQDAYTILCVGDSYVYGLGAPPGKSFPQQLEEMIRIRYPHLKVKVLNRGVPGQNSTELLKSLPGLIEETKPQILVVLTGLNNYWNFFGYGSYRNKRGLRAELSELLYSTSVYKFIRLVCLNIKDPLHRTAALISDGAAFFKSIIEKSPLAYVKALFFFEHKTTGLERKDDRDQKSAASKDTHEYIIAGWHYIDLGKYELALKYFNKAYRVYPDSLSCAGLGWTYHYMCERDEAIKWFIAAISKNTKNVSGYLGLGWTYSNMKQPDKSKQYFNVAVALEPDNYQGHFGLGWTSIAIKDFDTAYDSFTKALSLNPADGKIYYGLGLACKEIGRINEATHWFTKGTQVAPNEDQNYSGLGLIAQFQNNHEIAIQFFKKSIQCNPKRIENYLHVANSYRQLEKYDEAVQFYREAQKHIPLLREYTSFFDTRKIEIQEIISWLRHDLKQIIFSCKRNEIPIILQDYPYGDPSLLFIIKKTAESLKIPFVAHSEVFSELLRSVSKNQYFVQDWHCNENGYAIMAQSIYNTLLRFRLFEKSCGNCVSTCHTVPLTLQ